MSEKEKACKGLTRRGFLKTTGALGAVALAGSIATPTLEALGQTAAGVLNEQVFYSACPPNCENTCRLKITVRDGNIVKVTAADLPNNEYKRICIKGMTHAFRTYHPDRIKYPMRRVGDRGSGQWERISWDEALNEITDCWQSVRERFGKQAVMMFCGSGNTRFSATYNGLPSKLANVMECADASVVFDNNMVVGFTRVIGREYSNFWNQNEIVDLKNARNLFVWGANMPESQPQNWHFMLDAQAAGTKMWFINPKFNIGAAQADEFIPIRPASDTAVLMAMIKIIIENDWIDRDFCRDHTVAPFLVRQDNGHFLRVSDLAIDGEEYVVIDGETQEAVALELTENPALTGSFVVKGIEVKTALTVLEEAVAEFSPERASELSTVKPEKIEELARVYALDGPNTTFVLFGPDRFYNGHYFAHALSALAGITGNIGKPGASIGEHTLWAHFNGAHLNNPTGTSSIPVPGSDILEVITQGKKRGEDFPVKAIYAYNSNFVGNMSDQSKMIEALSDTNCIEQFVVCDFRLTDTTRYADIVVPSTYWFENEDAAGNGTHPYTLMMEKCIDPLFESKSDGEIINLLAERMGFGEYFQQTDIEYTEELLRTSPDAAEFGVTLDRLREEGAIRCIGGDDEHPYIFAEGGNFPTPTGRLEFYVEKPQCYYADPRFRPEDERMIRFIPPLEAWPDSELYAKYPLVFLQDHTRWRIHTQWSHDVVLRELDPEPVIYLSPEDAGRRGIKRGDMVRVFNDRGQMIVKALINRGMPSGVVNCPKGWQRDQYAGPGSFQDLTHGTTSPNSDNAIQFDVLVEVEPYTMEEGQ